MLLRPQPAVAAFPAVKTLSPPVESANPELSSLRLPDLAEIALIPRGITAAEKLGSCRSPLIIPLLDFCGNLARFDAGNPSLLSTSQFIDQPQLGGGKYRLGRGQFCA